MDLRGWRLGILIERLQRPPGDKSLEDGARITITHAATKGLNRNSGDAVQPAGKLLIEASPADVQICPGGPSFAGQVRIGPVGYMRVGAVRDKRLVGVYVGDEGV